MRMPPARRWKAENDDKAWCKTRHVLYTVRTAAHRSLQAVEAEAETSATFCHCHAPVVSLGRLDYMK